jgi:hypothetical protein
MEPYNSPCKGCPERFAACSDRCPKDARGEYGYKAWKAELEKFKAKKKEYIQQRREDWLRSEQRDAVNEKFVKSRDGKLYRRF